VVSGGFLSCKGRGGDEIKPRNLDSKSETQGEGSVRKSTEIEVYSPDDLKTES